MTPEEEGALFPYGLFIWGSWSSHIGDGLQDVCVRNIPLTTRDIRR